MSPAEPSRELSPDEGPAKLLGAVRAGGPWAALVAMSVVACSFGADQNAKGPGVGDGTEGGSSSSGDTPMLPEDGSTSIAGTTSGVGVDGTGTDSSSSTSGDDNLDTSGGESSTGDSLCSADGWWGPLWTHRRRLFIDNEGLGSTISDFPVLVRLNSDRIEYAVTQNNGQDLRFIASDGVTVLSHEVELWNESGDSFVWLKVPQIPPGDQGMPTIDLYFGNDEAPDTSEPAAVWTAGFTSVHHMGSMADATGTGHDGTPLGGPVEVPGFVGRGTLFDGVDDHIVLPDENHYDFEDDITVEVVLRIDAFDIPYQAVVTKGDNAWRLHRDNTSNDLAFANNDFWGSDSLTTASGMSSR